MVPSVRPQAADAREPREPRVRNSFNDVTRSKFSFGDRDTGNSVEEPERHLSPSIRTPPLPPSRYQNGARSSEGSVRILNELLSAIILPLRFLVVDDVALFAEIIGKMLRYRKPAA